jgi:hypothetical protein
MSGQGSPTVLPRTAALASVTRIADLAGATVAALPRDEWATGDYVACRVLDRVGRPHEIESTSGRMVEVIADDLLVGALGVRSATLEATGDWRAVGDDLRLHALTRAGVLGRATSVTPFARPFLVPLRYRGHLLLDGRKAAMGDFVSPLAPARLRAPVILVIGTSMSAGKTTSVITIVRRLVRMGLRVAGTKVTGVARYREILAMADAGASPVADFVDAGLPSTVCEPDVYRSALGHLVSRIAAAEPDVVVVECGASPLEPYNVGLAEEVLRPNVACTVLCASDPYAVVGVAQAHSAQPDLVAGRATSTDAGIALCERLAGVTALNLLDPGSHQALDELLVESLRRETSAHAPARSE